MGLAERRVIQEFKTNELPLLQSRVDDAVGQSVPVEAEWEKLAPEGESHLYVESWKAVYFEPLIAALKAIAVDEMSREALKTGLHKVIVSNASGNYYPDHWAKFDGGTLTLDHEPLTNAGDVQARTAKLITVLESGL